MFADDLVMLVETEEALLHNLQELNEYTLEKRRMKAIGKRLEL